MTPLSCWRFKAIDSWFFREARAHDAVGVSELVSLFPPPTRTLFGAVRTWLGDQQGVDWQTFAGSEAHAWLGDAETTGRLSIAEVQLHVRDDQGHWQRLWPCPANLLRGEWPAGEIHSQPQAVITRLVPGSVEYTDLGHVALPEPDPSASSPPASKLIQDAWLSDAGACAWLAGKVPAAQHIWTLDDLVVNESRLGIAVDHQRATAMKGQLYQTRHLRFIRETSVELWLEGVPADVLEAATAHTQTLRLGGEGRMAEVDVRVATSRDIPQPPSADNASNQLALWLTSPLPLAACDAVAGAPGFRPTRLGEPGSQPQDVWEGEINGIPLRMTCQCRPRAYREGGWDQQKHAPKAVRSYLPPGTILFCQRLDATPWEKVLKALHGRCLGGEPEWGRGVCLVGLSG